LRGARAFHGGAHLACVGQRRAPRYRPCHGLENIGKPAAAMHMFAADEMRKICRHIDSI